MEEVFLSLMDVSNFRLALTGKVSHTNILLVPHFSWELVTLLEREHDLAKIPYEFCTSL